MKIVYFSDSIIPSRRANSVHVIQVSNALSSLGHEVYTMIPDFKNIEKSVDDIFGYYGVPSSFKLSKLFYPNIRGRTFLVYIMNIPNLLRLDPDLIIGRSLNACFISSLLGFDTVFDAHGPIWNSGVLNQWLFKMMINRKSFIRMTVNSGALKDLYLKSDIFRGRRYNPENIVVAHNGANHYPLNDTIDLAGTPSKFKVGYFGHLYKGRGIELIYQLSLKLRDVDFYVIGGENEDVEYWKSKCDNDNIYFLGHINPGQVFKYRNSCDVLLAPYQSKVSTAGNEDSSLYMNPIKLLEYMSAKKPIIASDMKAIREILDEKTSVLVSSDDLKGWKNAIERIRDDQVFADSISNNAYNAFLKKHTWIMRARKLIGGNTDMPYSDQDLVK